MKKKYFFTAFAAALLFAGFAFTGIWAQSAVMKSAVHTARSATA